MEEIEYKLKTKNAILIVNAISKVVATILTKCSKEAPSIKNVQEYNFLRTKCEDPDPLVSIAACHGMVTLAKEGVLETAPTIWSFMALASLPSTRNFSGIIPSIGNIIVIDLKQRLSRDGSYECPFKLQSPTHPYITMLKTNKNLWPYIFHQMEFMSLYEVDDIVRKNSLKLFRPVFLYVLASPEDSLKSSDARQQTWMLLLQNVSQPEVESFLIEVLSWIQVESTVDILNASFMYVKIAEAALGMCNKNLCTAVTPSVASVGFQLVKRGDDPRLCLHTLSQLLAVAPEASSCVLVFLAEAITVSPIIYLGSLITVGKLIIETKACNEISADMLVCALLQWLIHPSFLTEEILQLASSAIELTRENTAWGYHTRKLASNKHLCALQNSDPHIDLTIMLSNLYESWQNDPAQAMAWLSRISSYPHHMTEKLHFFICALFLHSFDEHGSEQISFDEKNPDEINFNENKVMHECLKILLTLVKKKKELSLIVLTIILDQLEEVTNPLNVLELLQGLPMMAIQNENIVLILHTLESLKSTPSMRAVVLNLYVQLWKVEYRCYPYLHKMLLEDLKLEDSYESWEVDVARAAAINEVCDTRPEVHGAELVPLLSKILNDKGDLRGALPSSLALQGITALCEAQVVGITSTWKALAPKLCKDKRPRVIKSLCKFFGVVPTIHGAGLDYENLLSNAISRLWNLVSTSNDVDIIITALQALSEYSLDQLSLKSLPQNYRRNIKLPSAYAKTPSDAARKPEDVLPYIPGCCWPQLLENINPEALEAAADLVTHWMGVEVSAFHSGVYTSTVRKEEPPSYSALPHRSICQGIIKYLLHLSPNPLDANSELVAIQCIRILSHRFSKPLPPLNWSFLEEFLKKGKQYYKYCIPILAKQSTISISARRVLQQCFATQDKEEIVIIFDSLEDICNGIPPNILRPFIERSLHTSMTNALADGEKTAEDKEMLQKLLLQLKSTLSIETVHEANQTLLAMVVEGLLERLVADSDVFDMYVDCAVELPTKYLERMTSPSLCWEVTPEKLRQSIKFRCSLARRTDMETPLVWLNECIDASIIMPGEHTNMLQSMASVMAGCHDDKANSRWMLELMGHMQSLITNQTYADNQVAVSFLCDVFLVSIIVFSGHDCLSPNPEHLSMSRETRVRLFPQAVFSLLARDHWKGISLQVIEWLLHHQKVADVPPLYAAAFRTGLVVLRHDSHLNKLSVWVRVVEAKQMSA